MTTKHNGESDMMAEHFSDKTHEVDSADAEDAASAALVAQELAALGESPAQVQERAFLARGGAFDADSDVATVDTLFSIAHRTGPELDELGTRRVWAKIEGRMPDRQSVVAESDGRVEAPANTMVLRTVLAGFAVAASLVVLPRLGPEAAVDPHERAAQREALAQLGSSARAGLGQLGGSTDTARATALANAYADRLAKGGDVEVSE